MGRVALRYVISLGLAALATGGAAQTPTRASVTFVTGVFGGAIESNGTLWFSGWIEGISFYLPKDDAVDAQTLFPVLQASSESGRSLTVTVDPASGRFDGYHGRIAYRICAVVAGDKRFGPSDGTCPSTKLASSFGLVISPSLSLGVADSAANRAESIGELDAALREPDLDPALRLIALRARTDAHSLAAQRDRAGADPHRIAALHDAIAWTTLKPEDRDAWFAAGDLLTDLGAYDDAIRAFRAIGAHWRDEQYRVAIRVGSVLRVQKRYADALAELDRLVVAEGPQDGMRYHYHRGWTLNLLGRYGDAITEFSAGLATQPDLAWALLKRACAYGAIGNIAKAASDQQSGVRELTKDMSTQSQPLADDLADLVHARAVGTQLDALAGRNSNAATQIACEGYTVSQPLRTRSVLLTKADVAAAVGRWPSPQ